MAARTLLLTVFAVAILSAGRASAALAHKFSLMPGVLESGFLQSLQGQSGGVGYALDASWPGSPGEFHALVRYNDSLAETGNAELLLADNTSDGGMLALPGTTGQFLAGYVSEDGYADFGRFNFSDLSAVFSHRLTLTAPPADSSLTALSNDVAGVVQNAGTSIIVSLFNTTNGNLVFAQTYTCASFLAAGGFLSGQSATLNGLPDSSGYVLLVSNYTVDIGGTDIVYDNNVVLAYLNTSGAVTTSALVHLTAGGPIFPSMNVLPDNSILLNVVEQVVDPVTFATTTKNHLLNLQANGQLRWSTTLVGPTLFPAPTPAPNGDLYLGGYRLTSSGSDPTTDGVILRLSGTTGAVLNQANVDLGPSDYLFLAGFSSNAVFVVDSTPGGTPSTTYANLLKLPLDLSAVSAAVDYVNDVGQAALLPNATGSEFVFTAFETTKDVHAVTLSENLVSSSSCTLFNSLAASVTSPGYSAEATPFAPGTVTVTATASPPVPTTPSFTLNHVTATVTDICGASSSAPVINSTLTATGTVGVAFTYAITATNSPTSYNATGLPAGLNINTNTGAITGTPTTSGVTDVTISATNGTGTGQATLQITIGTGTDIEMYLLNKGRTYEQSDASTLTLPATGAWYIELRANGAAEGAITSGTVTKPAPGGGVLNLVPADNNQDWKIDVPHVDDAAALETQYPPGDYVFNLVTAHDGNVTKTINYPASPVYADPVTILDYAGLQAINASAPLTLSWTPWAAGTANDVFVVFIENEAKNNTVFENDPLAVGSDGTSTSTDIPAGTLQPGQSYWLTVQAGKFYAPSTHVIPTGEGVVVTTTGTQVHIQTASAPTFTAHPANSTKVYGENATFTVGSTGNPAPALKWQVSTNGGTTWTDVANDATYQGATTGTLTVSGVTVAMSGYRYRAIATNTVGLSPSLAATLTVNKATAGVTLSNLTQTVTGSPLSPTVTTNPAGLSVALTFDGSATVPSAAGSYAVVATINDANYQGSANGTFVINLSTPVITSSLVANGRVGDAFTYTITASGGPTSFNATGLPAGLLVSTSTGAITGTPTAAGVSNVTISATNSAGTDQATLVLTVVTATSPNPPTSPHGAPTAYDTLTAAWSAVGGATGYRLDVATDADFTQLVTGYQDLDVGNVTSKDISGLPLGTYYVRVRAYNGGGTSASTASFSVDVGSRLLNLSTRGQTSPADPMIVGFYVSGAPKTLLIRVAAKALADLGVPGTLPNPKLRLVSTATNLDIATNDDWDSSDPDVIAAVAASGAGLQFEPGSVDSVIVAKDLDAGGYSAVVDSVTGAAGVVLVELYEIDSVGRLVNISTRGYTVTAGADVMIPGTYIGPTSKRLLIRVAGETLGKYITGVIEDPILEIYDGADPATPILSNDDWDPNDAELVATWTSGSSSQVAGLAFDNGSKDAALLVVLPKNDAGYTVLAKGKNGATGTVLVEIYEVR